MGHMVAQDTFVAELPDGPLAVAKGQVFDAKHAVVKLDKGRGLLFLPLEETPEDAPRPRSRAKAAAAAAPAAEDVGE